MTKKVLLGLGALVAVVAGVSAMSAFEAHVINVVAKIENALSVSTRAINFGTVFPQEHLNKPLTVQLSQSFLEEPNADDVEYIIRQKPKCGWTTGDGGTLIGGTATGHVVVSTSTGEVTIDCGEAPTPAPDPQVYPNAKWGLLPSLCEYISKEPDGEPANDDTTPSFHQPYTVVKNATTGEYELVWLDTKGYLAVSDSDLVDNWTIDLSVPCFGNYCAQDWEEWVKSINPLADPSMYTQPIENEHKIFGCDLWVEVTAISRTEEQGE